MLDRWPWTPPSTELLSRSAEPEAEDGLGLGADVLGLTSSSVVSSTGPYEVSSVEHSNDNVKR